MRCHFAPITMATIKKKQNQKRRTIVEDVDKPEPLGIAGENVKWCCYCGKQ